MQKSIAWHPILFSLFEPLIILFIYIFGPLKREKYRRFPQTSQLSSVPSKVTKMSREARRNFFLPPWKFFAPP